jgi:MFS family permease
VISGALLFLRDAFHSSPTMQGVVTIIALAGAAAGASVAGLLLDRFGRRPILITTATVFVAGSFVSALASPAATLGLPRTGAELRNV